MTPKLAKAISEVINAARRDNISFNELLTMIQLKWRESAFAPITQRKVTKH